MPNPRKISPQEHAATRQRRKNFIILKSTFIADKEAGSIIRKKFGTRIMNKRGELKSVSDLRKLSFKEIQSLAAVLALRQMGIFGGQRRKVLYLLEIDPNTPDKNKEIGERVKQILGNQFEEFERRFKANLKAVFEN